MNVYNSYAGTTAEVWGTEKPIIWLIEPDFIQYTYEEQTNPFSRQEAAILTEDINDTVKSQLPNAVISLFHATWTSNVAEYWSHFNLTKVDMINTTGMADQNGYFNDGDACNRAEATYAYLYEITGKPILADTSSGATTQNNTWSTSTADTINARIADGVSGVIIEPVPDNYEQQIATLNPHLNLPCRQQGGMLHQF
jgi:hypothetical protein